MAAGGSGAPRSADPLAFRARMTELEALMWRLGSSGSLPVALMGMVLRLDRRLAPADLEEALAGVVDRVPRLAERPGPATGFLPPAWQTDPGFSVRRHMVVAGRGDPMALAPGHRPVPGDERPPWRAVLVGDDSTRRGRSAVVFHLHHSYTDGLGGLRLLSELLLGGGGGQAGGEPEEGGPLGGPGEAGLLQSLAGEAGRAIGLSARLLPWAAGTLRSAWRDPQGLVRRAEELVETASGTLGAARLPASPLLARRSHRSVLADVSWPFERLRDAGRRLDATVNDVFIALLLEGLAHYHQKMGSAAPAVRVAIPISARGGPDAGMENQLFGTLIPGPLGVVDFEERVRLVHLIVAGARRQPWSGLVEDLAGVVNRLPGTANLAGAGLGSVEVVASNVPGPPVRLELAGAGVDGMVPFGPRSGAALNATFLSYAGAGVVGLDIDPAAFPDPDVVVDCLEAAGAEAL